MNVSGRTTKTGQHDSDACKTTTSGRSPQPLIDKQLQQERPQKNGHDKRSHSRIVCITWQGWLCLQQEWRRKDNHSTHRPRGRGCGMSGRARSSHGRGGRGRSSCDSGIGTARVSHGRRGLAAGMMGNFLPCQTRTTSNDGRPK